MSHGLVIACFSQIFVLLYPTDFENKHSVNKYCFKQYFVQTNIFFPRTPKTKTVKNNQKESCRIAWGLILVIIDCAVCLSCRVCLFVCFCLCWLCAPPLLALTEVVCVLVEFLCMECRRVHIYFKRLDMREIPHEPVFFRRWLHERFEIKDQWVSITCHTTQR